MVLLEGVYLSHLTHSKQPFHDEGSSGTKKRRRARVETVDLGINTSKPIIYDLDVTTGEVVNALLQIQLSEFANRIQ